MKVEIIIPAKQINRYIFESIPEILDQNYENYGIIIFPDTFNGESFPKTKIIPTGNIGPAQKRDLALKYSNADILAFLDDDAYPRKDWLKNAIRNFDDPNVAAVGGPAVTLPDDSFWQLRRVHCHNLRATIVVPYLGTPMFEEARQKDWLLTEDWERYDMRETVMASQMSNEDIKELTQMFYKSFASPQYFMRRILSVRGIDDLRFLWRAGKKLIGHLIDFEAKEKHC